MLACRWILLARRRPIGGIIIGQRINLHLKFEAHLAVTTSPTEEIPSGSAFLQLDHRVSIVVSFDWVSRSTPPEILFIHFQHVMCWSVTEY